MSVTKTADKDRIEVGETVTYTITVTNTGNQRLENISVTDVFSGRGELELSGDTLPAFITGDFNAQPSDPIFAPITARFPSARTAAPDTDNLGSFNGFGAEQGTVIYDYIFSRKARALEFHTVTDSYRVPYASDHYPVEALFELP